MLKEKLFSFKAGSYNLEVVSFKGTQAISELYRYDIELISTDEDIDFDKMLNMEVCLVLHDKEKEDTYLHGVLEYFEAYQKVDEYIYYRATLVPKLWWLSVAHHQQIFLNKNISDIIEDILKESRFTSSDYELRLQESYDKREYVCQYKESRYDFLLRWMQRDGLYFFFEQDESGCKFIITDAKEKQQKAFVMDTLLYRPTSGLQGYTDQAVSSIVYRSKNTIKSVHMKNFNYEKPSQDINSVKNSKGDDYTQTYMFGHNILTQDEAIKLTKINEERFRCQAKEMLGESNVLSLHSGYIYSLKDYFRSDLNDDYMMVRVESEGSQRGFLSAGFSDDGDDASYYRNSFMMIPAKTQFRDQTTSLWPHIGGMLSAIIDGAGSGDTAELDKHGRYKVIMPFDISGRKDAKASAYLRMAQPSAGEKQGMHFPLHKGTEVLIAFKGGDPDQPIITGAVPNINSPSPVNEDNVTKSVIQTHGGNIIHMEDTPGQAHIHMSVHDGLSSMTLHNQDDDDDDDEEWGISLYSEGGFQLGSAKAEINILGEKFETFVGLVQSLSLSETFELYMGPKQEIGNTHLYEYITGTRSGVSVAATEMRESIDKAVTNITQVVNEDHSVTNNITQVIENKVEITEDMIAEFVKNIVSGMNLTEALEKKISTIESDTTLKEELIKLIDTEIAKVDNIVKNVNESLIKGETRLDLINAVMNKSKLHISKSNVKSALVTLNSMSAELTVFD